MDKCWNCDMHTVLPLDACYRVRETPSASYLQRTEWNVRDSDATIVFTLAPRATGGSLKTIEFARNHRKPCLHFHSGLGRQVLDDFLTQHSPERLNIAGNREEKESGVYAWTRKQLGDGYDHEIWPAPDSVRPKENCKGLALAGSSTCEALRIPPAVTSQTLGVSKKSSSFTRKACLVSFACASAGHTYGSSSNASASKQAKGGQVNRMA